MNTPAVSQPFILSEADAKRFAHLAQERFGLHFSENRRSELQAGLRQAFAASTCTDLNSYYYVLCNSADGALELERLANALTVGETYFFRDVGQFNALWLHILPGLIERRRDLHSLRIWSAGCASGEEPYSIAMLLRELLPDIDDWSITILGTDINTRLLNIARKGLYSEWAFREERARSLRGKYFLPRGEPEAVTRRFELRPEVQRMVTFAELNLAQDDYPSFNTNTCYMDLILCRNVTIYFQEDLTRRIAARFYEALAEDGWLVVGHSEHSLNIYQQFQAHSFPDAILYQRGPVAGSLASPPPVPAKPAQRPLRQTAPLPVLFPALSQVSPEEALEAARDLILAGNIQLAQAQLLGLHSLHPAFAPVCQMLGQVYSGLGDWPQAEAWCRKAIQRDVLCLDAYYTLALVLQHEGRTQEAIEAMKKVIYINRNDALGHYGLADLYHVAGQIPQALKSLDNTLRLLATRGEEELIQVSGDVTVSRLRDASIRQQQQWMEEARKA